MNTREESFRGQVSRDHTEVNSRLNDLESQVAQLQRRLEAHENELLALRVVVSGLVSAK